MGKRAGRILVSRFHKVDRLLSVFCDVDVDRQMLQSNCFLHQISVQRIVLRQQQNQVVWRGIEERVRRR